jgi:hypothetical protein
MSACFVAKAKGCKQGQKITTNHPSQEPFAMGNTLLATQKAPRLASPNQLRSTLWKI